jgi:predicted aconitase
MFCSERQGTLDNVVTTQPRTPLFTSAGLLNYIVELVVNEDDVCIYLSLRNCGLIFLKAFQLVDKGIFRRLLTYLRPSLMDKDIPHRTKIRTEIIERAKAVEERVKAKLQV